MKRNGHNWRIKNDLLIVKGTSIFIEDINNIEKGRPWWIYFLGLVAVLIEVVLYNYVSSGYSIRESDSISVIAGIGFIVPLIILANMFVTPSISIKIHTKNKSYTYSTWGGDSAKSYLDLYNNFQ